MGGKKVLVGMSGGIDSSVTAHLLASQGYDVQGVTMTLWRNGPHPVSSIVADACFSPNEKKDVEKSAEICRKLGISHFVLDVSDAYEKIVLGDFRSEYAAGRTPNPCVLCNEKIKFGAMVESARKAGIAFDFFATGHYARVVRKNGRFAIARAKDDFKDQSYFLHRLHQEQLGMVMFPLGGMTKAEVRKIDVALGFHPEGQSESMDFYSGDYADLLNLPPRKGNIVDCDGKVVGSHDGYWNYTIGQRKGLGIGGSAHPLYVVSIVPERNEVVVGASELTKNHEVSASNLSFMGISEEMANGEYREYHDGFAKIRSAGKPSPCRFRILGERLEIAFETPVLSACCGQSAVVYGDDGVVMVGGIIDSVR